MRKSILLLTLMISCIPCLAQKYKEEWTGILMKEGAIMCFIFDYSNTVFDNYSFDDYCELDPDFSDDLKDAESRYWKTFLKEAVVNKWFKERKIKIRQNPDDADYFVVIIPSRFKKKGDFKGEMKLIDKEGNTLALFHNIWGVGGSFGSFTNLIGDAYERHAMAMCEIFGNAMKEGKL